MSLKWETDADKMNVNLIHKLLFRNSVVDEFIDTDNKYFLVASKGIGKTLLLKYKRYELEKKYSYEIEDDKGMIFIPSGKPYLDFSTDLGILSKDHLDLLSDWKNCKMLWELAIETSVLSYYCKRTHKRQVLEKIKKEILESESDGSESEYFNPFFVLNEILRMNRKPIMKFLQNYSNKIRREFTTIPSGIIVFIDRVDQALLHYNSELWIAIQIGLIEASWDLMRMNPHVKIYTSIRQEAYANYASPNKEAISGEVSFIRYSSDELHEILDKLSQCYEKVDSYYDFIGFRETENLSAKRREDSFQYIYRHTIGRPRDLVSICSKLSPIRQTSIDEKKFRRIVNETASTDIVGNIFSEIEILLDTLKNKDDRERLLALLPYNILSLDELKNICREFNGLHRCKNVVCKDCDGKHPFCDFYNVGLLGIVEKDKLSNKLKQKFVEPYEMNQFSNYVLPVDSPYYLIHPAIHFYINRLRNKFFGEQYNLITPILIGNKYDWEEKYGKIVEARKMIDSSSISDEKVKQQLLDIVNDFEKPQGVIGRLNEFKNKVKGTRIAMELIRTIEAISTIFHE